MSGKGRKGPWGPRPPPQTDLQAQLAQLAVAQGVDQGRRHRGKASLLYSFQEAADIDAETIQRIGIEGEAPMGAMRGLPLPPPLAGSQWLPLPPARPHCCAPTRPPLATCLQGWTSCAHWTAGSMSTAARCSPRQQQAIGTPTRQT